MTEGDVVFSFCFRGDRDQGERGDNGRRTEITEPGKIIIHSYRNNNTEKKMRIKVKRCVGRNSALSGMEFQLCRCWRHAQK